MKIISWNIARRSECWRRLLHTGADLALLQEAAMPPPDVAKCIEVNPGPWLTAGGDSNCPWRAAIVRLSDRILVEWIEAKSIGEAKSKELAVSH